MRLRWTESARLDLLSIQAFIAQDSPRYADAVVDRIVSRAAGIVNFPHSGSTVPEYAREDIREVLVHSFRLIYRAAGDEVLVLAVIHGSQLLPESPPIRD